MPIGFLFLAVLSLFFAQLALAQQMYRWKDEKGQWVYSNFVPAGVTAEKMGTDDAAPQSVSQPSVPTTGEKKKAESIASDRSSQGASDPDPVGSASRRLLVFPPSAEGKPLSEWIPVESFANAEECDNAKALHIVGLLIPGSISGWLPDLNSRCITLAEYKPSKEANVIVAVMRVTYDPAGFSTPVIYGKVFNRGQNPARDVVVKYQVRDPQGTIYAEGAIPTTPREIAPTMFADFKGQIVGSPSLIDRRVHTEANWSKD
jgi:hypothetical protein